MKLCFPEKILDQHLVVLGKTGAGKSSALRHIVEHLLRHKKRVCIIDPKGDWAGLKSSADGKEPGFPVIGFGNFKEPKATDVPLNPQSGKHVAELITSGNRPCIIGFRGWMPGQMTDFWLDFAPALFNANEGELYVVIDEVHNFAPKGKILDPKAGRVIHWTNRLLAEGRGLGLIFLIASQRPQKVHNDTLTCCETLVAMRVNHAADRQATKDWIDGCGDKAQGMEVLNNLAQLSRGEAYVWSPEIGFGPTRLKFPMFETFDSFAPPQLQRKISESGWSAVDLDAVKTKLAAVIEEAKENDPIALKKTIQELRQALRQAQTAKGQVDPQEVEKAVQRALGAQQQAFNEAVDRIKKQGMDVGRELKVVAERLETLSAAVMTTDIKLPAQKEYVARPRTESDYGRPSAGSVNRGFMPPRAASQNGHSKKLRDGAERMLSALVSWHPNGMKEGQMRAMARMKKSGTYTTYKSDLRQGGYIEERGGLMFASSAGLSYFGDNVPVAPQTTKEVVSLWSGKLRDGARRMLQVLIEAGGEYVDKETLAQRAGLTESGTFTTYISDLRTANLIVSERGSGFAANRETLFL
jgi:hypothetical protein